jgi:hypothetical protein
MPNLGVIGPCVIGLVLCGIAATAQDFGRYREFELGSAVAAVSMLTGVAESELMTAEPVAALARTAASRAAVLDAREAPQREADRQKKEADDRRAAEEKAPLINKPIFRP